MIFTLPFPWQVRKIIKHRFIPHYKTAFISFSASITSGWNFPVLYTLIQGVTNSTTEDLRTRINLSNHNSTILISHQKRKAQWSSETCHSNRMRDCLNKTCISVSFLCSSVDFTAIWFMSCCFTRLNYFKSLVAWYFFSKNK